MSENNLETIKYKELKDKINRGAKKKRKRINSKMGARNYNYYRKKTKWTKRLTQKKLF